MSVTDTESFFSIVSVSRNCANDVEKTIQSVKNQNFADYEYLVIDGKSTDGTTELEADMLKSMKNAHLICEKDNGIYDAMNKGIQLSKGKYLLFLNMGDVLYDENVLRDCHELISHQEEETQIYYGDVYCGTRYIHYSEKINAWMFLRERMICHQGIFAARFAFENNLFDTNYRICADRKWLYECYRRKYGFIYLNLCVSIFDDSGISQDNAAFLNESRRLIKEEYGLPGELLIHIKRIVGKIVRKENQRK